MKVEAVYEHGRLRFLQPITLRDEQVRVMVEIPEDAIDRQDPYAGLDEHSRALVAALDAIRNAPIPAERDAEVSTKTDRVDAFGLYRDV